MKFARGFSRLLLTATECATDRIDPATGTTAQAECAGVVHR
jgi:hypothetical protein